MTPPAHNNAQILLALEKARASFTQHETVWLDAPFGHPVYAPAQGHGPCNGVPPGEALAALFS